MRAQRINRVIVTRKFCFGQRGMYLAMADMVQEHHGPTLATAQFGDQVVQTLRHALGDRAQTERTQRNWFV